MYKNCQTEQSAARQRELEQGLLELMLTRRYEDITVSDLCEKMQIPRKAFYRYFSGKDGALQALMDHTLIAFYGNPHGKKYQKTGTAVGDLEYFFYFWQENSRLIDALQRNAMSGMLFERAVSLAQREQLMPRQLLHWQQDLQSAALSFAICGLMAMVIQWHQDGYRISAQEIASLATSMLSRPLLPK